MWCLSFDTSFILSCSTAPPPRCCSTTAQFPPKYPSVAREQVSDLLDTLGCTECVQMLITTPSQVACIGKHMPIAVHSASLSARARAHFLCPYLAKKRRRSAMKNAHSVTAALSEASAANMSPSSLENAGGLFQTRSIWECGPQPPIQAPIMDFTTASRLYGRTPARARPFSQALPHHHYRQ